MDAAKQALAGYEGLVHHPLQTVENFAQTAGNAVTGGWMGKGIAAAARGCVQLYDNADGFPMLNGLEQYFAGGPRNLPWRDEWAARGTPIHIEPGEAIYVPILAPHWVQTHGQISVSLSLTWRSEWSFHHADACRFKVARNIVRAIVPVKPSNRWRHPRNYTMKSVF